MFNRIRNAQAVQKETVDVPFSKFKYQIAKILEENGLIKKADRKGRTTRKSIVVTLKYVSSRDNKGGQNTPAISHIKRISKPGQRIYAPIRAMGRMRRGGLMIISTPKGLMTDREARKNRLGGEVICEVW